MKVVIAEQCLSQTRMNAISCYIECGFRLKIIKLQQKFEETIFIQSQILNIARCALMHIHFIPTSINLCKILQQKKI